MLMLAILFFTTAVLYAAVGFGGGSTYNALLVLNGVDYRLLPSIALVCNIIVVTGNVWRFTRKDLLDLRRMIPWLIASVPAAWLGGRIEISQTVFIGVLGIALLASGLRLVLERENTKSTVSPSPTKWSVALPVGGGIGFVSGLSGIGGGIFLAPILYLLRWDTPRRIAAASSLFILVNSLSGLAGQMMKLGSTNASAIATTYWPLFVAVLIGGQIGSRLATTGLRASTIKRMTAILILYVAARLLWKWIGLVA